MRVPPAFARLILLAGLFAVLCLLRWPLADRPIRDVDEAVSALIANAWLEGGVPYRDAIDQRGPVTYLLYAFVFAIAGKGNMAAVHGFLLLLIFGGALLADRFARRLGEDAEGRAWGLLAALLVVVSSSTYRSSQLFAFHTEWPTLVLSTLGFYLTWQATRPGGERPRRALFLAGLAFGASFLSKQPALFDGAAAGGFVLLVALLDRRLASRDTLVRATALAGGFAVAVGACVAYFAFHGALGDFYLYFWSYNVEHYTAVVPVADRLAALDPWRHERHYLRTNPLLLAGAVAGVAYAGWRFLRRGRQRERLDDARLLLVLWFLAAYFGASYSGRNFGHYFIQIISPACLLTARTLLDLWHGARLLAAERGLTALRLARGALALAAGGAMAFTLYRCHRDFWLFERLRPARPRPTYDSLVGALQSSTGPEDKIFVWGYDPEVYFLAQRRPSSRYSNTNYLTGMLPWENHQPGVDTSAHIVPGSWDVLLRELEASRPAAVIDTVPGNHRFYRKYPIASFPRLEAFLDTGYRRAVRVPGRNGRPYYDVYLRKDRASE